MRSLLSFAATVAVAFAYTPLSDETLKNIPGPGDDFDINTGALLSPLLKVRVPGTEGIAEVQHHLIDFFRNTLPEWELELHNSTSTTPLSNGEQVPFVNIIATRDPPWAKKGDIGRLALVAHYDSKVHPEGFIGATDSAAPVAMIMHAVRSIDIALAQRWEKMKENGDWQKSLEGEKGVQVLLLDGEEAFVSWTNTDSLYGARALAETWDQTTHTAMSTYHNYLSSIELFLLLDLLGAKNPRVPSYFRTTHWAYKAMAELETRLRKLGLFKSSPNHPSKQGTGENKGTGKQNGKSKKNAKGKKKRAEPAFLPDSSNTQFMGGYIEDDHVPFMARGVEILHIIPSPFPKVWHELADDGQHLDMDTVEDWAKLVTAFVGEWMDLEGNFYIYQTVPPRDEEGQQGASKSKKKGKEYTRKTELEDTT